MENMHWELAVLSKSIHYKNLSAAAEHVGLSQPQLSRIISKLEGELGVVLLDRTVRRKSGWTPVAYKIADAYLGSERRLDQALQQLKSGDEVTHLTIGILEGLTSLANDFCRQAFSMPKMKLIELNVYDLSELEERFEKDELDLIFTCREPGQHKHSYVRNLGYQVLKKTAGTKDSPLQALSPFEYASHLNRRTKQEDSSLVPGKTGTKTGAKSGPKTGTKTLISNSLMVRRLWVEEQGATGYVPSDVKVKKTADDDVPVFLIAQDVLMPAIWEKFRQIRL